MHILTITITLLLLSGLAVQQVSRILMYGSIFGWLRNYIDRKAPESWFFTKMAELFSCKLCLTTQVALTFFSPPLVLFTQLAYRPFDWMNVLGLWVEVAALIYIWFFGSMAIACVARGIWDVLEYVAAKKATARAPKVLNTKIETLMQRVEMLIAQQGGKSGGFVTAEEFQLLCNALAEKCDNIICGRDKAACQNNEALLWAECWWNANVNRRVGINDKVFRQAALIAAEEFLNLLYGYPPALAGRIAYFQFGLMVHTPPKTK